MPPICARSAARSCSRYPRRCLILELRAGATVDIGIDDGRLIVVPRTKPSYTLDELLAQCDETAPADHEDRAWLEGKPLGNELL